MADWDEYADYVDGPKAATNPTLPNADELEVVAYQSDVAQLAKTIVLCCQYTWKKDRKAAYEKAERLLSAHTAAALSSAQAQIAELREALEQAQSNEDRLLKAINATDLSSEQKAFIADHLERSRPARSALSGGTSNG